MRTGRLEAFSDGVLAIIITIMVLELHRPEGEHFSDLADSVPGLLGYLISFVYIGIYWNNHHHLLQITQRVNGRVLWANLLLLFSLSLIPFTTAWLEEAHFARDPVIAYGLNLFAAGLCYFVLYRAILACDGPDSHVARAITSDVKERLSLVLYALGIGLAFVQPLLGVAPFVAVAVMWLIPDTRLERYIAEHSLAD